MEIYPAIDNPIIKDHSDFIRLRKEVLAVEPQLREMYLYKNRIVIVNIAKRSFMYPRKPTIEWVIDRVKEMIQKEL